MTAIDVRDLRKTYDGVEAVGGVSFEVAAGELFCLLGPNGAGKTTTVEILEGYRLPGVGRVRVLGHDPARGERSFRERIGIVLQEGGAHPELSVVELLEMYSTWYPHPRPVDQVLELVELEADRNARVPELSGGLQRRLDLALALVGDPDLLFLDEPTTGFDPHARRRAWSTIRSLLELGKTIVLTTHYMDEAQALADRVAVMVHGKLVAVGPPAVLAGRNALPSEIRFALPDGVDVDELPPIAGAEVTISERTVAVRAGNGLEATHLLTGWALERGLSLPDFSVTQPSLEDVYLSLTEEPPARPAANEQEVTL
jgi:ABC-2 type transport system ATP-binding protein